MKFLDDRGLRENTILIFATDNGGADGVKVFNAGMRGEKGSPMRAVIGSRCLLSGRARTLAAAATSIP